MHHLRLGLFIPAVAVWTYLLLEPKPVPDVILEGIGWFDWEMLHFLLAKTLHLTAYAILAIIGGPLLSRPRRWLIFAGLILHGIGTEIGQMYVPNRFGCVRDMVIDAVGVSLGALALNRFRSPFSFRSDNSRATTE